MKSHMGFPAIPQLMTLNDLERRSLMAVIMRYVTEFATLGGQLRHSGWTHISATEM